ncbi:unnamed protein product [Hymenolepis diminuta]|uniref:tRNA-synt_2 domain-containing protein n=1 Tax=Hymenolepis diminuta TaxID=6216 RepID=A0A0R3SYP8_HYMDI|nr:unnamed protein product [Hymenolepis diminuta]
MDSIESAKIAAIGRSIREQMNLSKPDKDSEDYIKNVGEFHYEPSHIIDNRIAGLVDTPTCRDDSIVVGESEEELQGRVEKLLKPIEKYGFHLRADEYQFFLTSAKFSDSIFDSAGRRSNPDEIHAIVLSEKFKFTSFFPSVNILL